MLPEMIRMRMPSNGPLQLYCFFGLKFTTRALNSAVTKLISVEFELNVR